MLSWSEHDLIVTFLLFSSTHFQAATPGALFEDKPQSANDTWRKLHSDPLLLIRQWEQDAISRIKNNPIKMAEIKEICKFMFPFLTWNLGF